jgi:hypothetical protein
LQRLADLQVYERNQAILNAEKEAKEEAEAELLRIE